LIGWRFQSILPALGERSTAFINQQAKARQLFLLYLALTAPHAPIAPNEGWKKRSALNHYADFVMEVDDVVGWILSTGMFL
jgi:arylsulfatase A